MVVESTGYVVVIGIDRINVIAIVHVVSVEEGKPCLLFRAAQDQSSVSEGKVRAPNQPVKDQVTKAKCSQQP